MYTQVLFQFNESFLMFFCRRCWFPRIYVVCCWIRWIQLYRLSFSRHCFDICIV